MIRQTVRRPGVTLMEVLIATGILAVGMLAIMALFPIGAVSMARAINQNRAADHAANSDAMFRYYWKKAWLDQNGNIRPIRGGPVGTNAVDVDPYLVNYLDTYPSAPNIVAVAGDTSAPSLVVLVDPIGYHTQTGQSQIYICGSNTFPTRTSLAAAEADPLPRTRVRLTTLLDDMSWDVNGEPSALAGQLDRGGRYNVAWLIQRQKNSVPHEVRLFVLVYGGRSPTDTPSAETQYPNSFVTGYYSNVDPKPNTITVPIPAGQTMPNVRRGSWIGFSTIVAPQGGGAYTSLDMYRVAAVTDNIAASQQVVLELEQPLRSYDVNSLVGANYNNVAGSFVGWVICFDNLIEVFDRGIVSAQGISGR
jgi:hypothetical protein